MKYARCCVDHVHRNGKYPGGVDEVNWRHILKDCRMYIELSEKQYEASELCQRGIDNYKMECIEHRLRKYAVAARNWGRNK